MKESVTRRIRAAQGLEPAELVFKNASVVNVFTEELETADVAVTDGYIVGIGAYSGEREIDLTGKILCPGFWDGHIHLESSMVTPTEFTRAVLPHGTVGVVTDPHELANVAGTEGIDYILRATENLPLSVYVMLPSCVPACPMEEAGATLTAADLRPYYENPRVLGLAEMMNAPGVLGGAEDVFEKISDAVKQRGCVDGHAPGLSGKALNAYITADIRSDHESSTAEEAMEKLRRGQWVMLREGTAAKNLAALLPLCRAPYADRCMFVTDDKHPGDLLRLGHIDGMIRTAVKGGADPIRAIKMASWNPARWFGLRDRGAAAPGYRADLVVLDDLKSLTVEQVYIGGVLTAEKGALTVSLPEPITPGETLTHSMHCAPVTAENLRLRESGNTLRAIGLVDGELITTEVLEPFSVLPGLAPGVDPERDIVKMAVIERHHNTGHIGLGFMHGYGLKRGAVAISVAHDSHNLIVAGCTEEDMALAANTVTEQQGGIAVCAEGKVLGKLPLTVGGLMSTEPLETVDETLEKLKAITKELGVRPGVDAFMTLAFTSLPVIPALRLNGRGLIDVARQEIIPAVFDR